MGQTRFSLQISTFLLLSASACSSHDGTQQDASAAVAGNVNASNAEAGSTAPPMDAALDAISTSAPRSDAASAMPAGGKPDAAAPLPMLDAAQADAGGALPESGVPTDAGAADAGPRVMTPIPAPVADDCITKVSAGDHVFTCSGVTFLVKLDELCTKFACGLIFDVHGGTMGGLQMRDNTKLHELAPKHGYIVVHPSATPENTGGSWDLMADPPKIVDFFQRMTKAFHTDATRHHVTGFSQGSAVTFYFLCKHSNLLASAAPISGNSADTTCINAMWQPRVPFLFMSGTKDTALVIDTANMRINTIVSQLGLMGGTQIAGDGHYTRKRWTGTGGMELDYIVHDYGGQAALDGHCIPGGTDVPGGPNNLLGLNATTCTTGDIKLNWGPTALQYFLDHPKR